MSGLSYESSGVNYDRLDAFKRAAQHAAAATTPMLAAHGLSEPAGIRGESAYLIEAQDHFLAHVEEGLGTKNLIADAMAAVGHPGFYRNIGVDLVATMVNDLITVGALPVSIAMHAAVGDAEWFADAARSRALADGFALGCIESGAVWGGGETPTLSGIINPATIALAGSAVGRIRPKCRRIRGDVRPGDAIILIASSGVQTNGLTLCRALADRLPQGYLTPIAADGPTYGAALLDPSVIYVKLMSALADAEIIPHYAVHVTGHGWRKLMRLNEPFVYRVTSLREAPAIFKFIQERGGLDDREAYGTFNMGVGFAIYVAPEQAARVVRIAQASGYTAWHGGAVEKHGDAKAVVVEPLDLTFEGQTLQIR